MMDSSKNIGLAWWRHRVPRLEVLLDRPLVYFPFSGKELTAVAGWGRKKSFWLAHKTAKRRKIPCLTLEDGFLRSVGLGNSDPPLSVVVDDLGIYYDATIPSRLEKLLEVGGWESSQRIERAKEAIDRIVQERLSKYNHAPLLESPLPGTYPQKILVIDQTYGDASVTHGLADAETFSQMLTAALEENPEADVIVKTHPDVLAGKKRGYLTNIGKSSSRVHLLAEEINPLSLIEKVSRVYTVTSQMGFEALLLGKPVECFGMPFYAGWGLTNDRQTCARRTRRRTLEEVFAAAYMQYARYVDPITGQRCEIEQIITLLADRRRHWLQTRGGTLCSGVSPWKRKFLPGFLSQTKQKVRFVKSPQKAIAAATKNGCRWVLWASQETEELRQLAQQQGVSMLRVEDAFLRSVGLGSDLTRPGSLVLDDEGIYYDASRPSRLESLLRQTDFSEALLSRARKLHQAILKAGLTKYNVGNNADVVFPHGDKRLVLVPGQVEDDASVLRGSPQVRSNLELLRQARLARPEAFIIYKPHPDVLVGNRRGGIPPEVALQSCDQIVTDLDMGRLLAVVDEVHTMTSLTGFEALLRDKKVVCYGLPFYAGWGLTEDLLDCCRRGRQLTLDQLVAGALILYPTYVDPKSGQVCTVEHFLDWLARNRDNVAGPPWKTRMIRFFQRLRQTGWLSHR